MTDFLTHDTAVAVRSFLKRGTLVALCLTAVSAAPASADLYVGIGLDGDDVITVTGTDDDDWARISDQLTAGKLTLTDPSQGADTVIDDDSDPGCTRIGAVGSVNAKVECALTDIESVYVNLGDGDDVLARAISDDDADQVTETSLPIEADGGDGADTLAGGSGADELNGDGGADFLYGNEGVDVLSGGLDADWLDGGDGADKLAGDAGDDYLLTRDEVADTQVDCGAGTGDRVWADNSLETPAGCETIAPEAVTLPVVTGNLQEGGTVTSSVPSFNGTASTIAYRWFYCTTTTGTSCITGPLTTAPTLTLGESTGNRFIIVDAIATNAAGTAIATSKATARVKEMPKPVVTKPVTPKVPPVVVIPSKPAPVVVAASFGRKGRTTVSRTATSFKVDTGDAIACSPAGKGPCGVTLVAKSKQGRRNVTVGARKWTLPRGTNGKFLFTLNKAAARRLRQEGRLKLTVSVVINQQGATSATKAVTLTIKKPRR